jgi:hypothetical protein
VGGIFFDPTFIQLELNAFFSRDFPFIGFRASILMCVTHATSWDAITRGNVLVSTVALMMWAMIVWSCS